MKRLLGLIMVVLLIGAVAGCNSLFGSKEAQLAITLTDAQATGIDQVVVTITKVEIQQEDGEENEAGKRLLNDLSAEPLQVDLLTLRFDEQLLGDASLPEGTYHNIWISVEDGIDNSYVVVGGVKHELKVPSLTFKIPHEFTIETGVITELVLDTDVRDFIGLRGNVNNNNGYIINPTAIRVYQKQISSDLFGQVLATDESAIVDVDVNIDVYNADQELIGGVIALREDFTDADGDVHPAGSFVVKGLLSGTYSLQVYAEGYEEVTLTDITLGENENITLEETILLHPVQQ